LFASRRYFTSPRTRSRLTWRRCSFPSFCSSGPLSASSFHIHYRPSIPTATVSIRPISNTRWSCQSSPSSPFLKLANRDKIIQDLSLVSFTPSRRSRLHSKHCSINRLRHPVPLHIPNSFVQRLRSPKILQDLLAISRSSVSHQTQNCCIAFESFSFGCLARYACSG
jgi:hypothetical protein